MRRLIALLLICSSVACLGADLDLPATEDLLFYLSFDKGTDADFSRGAAKPSTQRGAGAADGFSIGGLRFHREDGVAECAFPAEGCIDAMQGTVAFHFQPNWAGAEYGSRMFFSFPGPNNPSGGANAPASLTLYTFRHEQPLQELWLWLDDSGGGNNTAKTCIAEWKKGEWRHIAATWDSTNIQIYIDGELKARKHVRGAIGTPGKSFYIGSGIRGRDNVDGIMDNFCIYRRALTASEIGLLSGRKEFTTPHIHALVPQQHIFYTSECYVPFGCEAGGKISADTHEIEVLLTSTHGLTIARANEPVGQPFYVLRVQVSEEGDCVLRAALRERASGKVVAAKETRLRFIKGPFAGAE